MRPIYLAQLDKVRPVAVLTREIVRPHLRTVTVAPIMPKRGTLSSEVAVGPVNGVAISNIDGVISFDNVISLDNVTTVPVGALLRRVGHLLETQEVELTAAIVAAFDLE